MDLRTERKIIENAYRRRAALRAARYALDAGTRSPVIRDETEIVEGRTGAWVTCKVFVSNNEIREAAME